MSTAIRKFIDFNHRISRRQDRIARKIFGRRDGNTVWLEEILPSLLKPGLHVLDVGGGKNPAIRPEVKASLGLRVSGLDICGDELDRAPAGSYDEMIVADIASAELEPQYDLVVSTAVLEHVKDVASAMRVLSQAVAPGGRMGHFVPCGRSVFARVNRALGHERARGILYSLYPSVREDQGFDAFYDHCWPSAFRKLTEQNGLKVRSIQPFYQSGYLTFFFPMHSAEIVMQLAAMFAPVSDDRCESFVLIAERSHAGPKG